MPTEKKETYEATSPIKRNGKRYDIGDTLKLTEEEAEGLHVKPASGSGKKTGKKSSEKEDEFLPLEGSHENDAKPSIEFIESADEDELKGFVDPDEETRVTVLRAWDERFGTDYSGD